MQMDLLIEHVQRIGARTVRFCKTLYFNDDTIITRISSQVFLSILKRTF